VQASGPPANCELTEKSPLFDMMQPASGHEDAKIGLICCDSAIGGILAASTWCADAVVGRLVVVVASVQ
jgi:hypothetical protein